MSAPALFAEATAAGLALRLDADGLLRVTGRASTGLLARLREHKADLARLLAAPPPFELTPPEPTARKRKAKAGSDAPEWHDLGGWRALLQACRDRKARQAVIRWWAALFPGVVVAAAGGVVLPAELPPCEPMDALRSAVPYYGLEPGAAPVATARPAVTWEELAPVATETLWEHPKPQPVTILCADTVGQVMVERLQLVRLERRSVPRGEVVTRVILAGGGFFSRGPGAPLLILAGRIVVKVPEHLAGAALWTELRRQAAGAEVIHDAGRREA